MAAGQWDTTIEQGASWVRTVTWLDGDTVDSDPVNITGYTARMQIKDLIPGVPLADLDPWIELTTANSRISLGGAAGTVRLSLSAAETAALEAPLHGLQYDLELVNGVVVTRLLQGKVRFSEEVTS